MKVTTRIAKAEDCETLTALCMRSKQAVGYTDVFMAQCADDLAVTKDRLARGAFFVAEADVILGCACLKPSKDPNIGEVASFFIDPDHQKRGIGKVLWSLILEEAQKQNLAQLFLNADPAAEGFYQRLGFSTKAHMPSGSIAGRTLPYMTLDLEDLPRALSK